MKKLSLITIFVPIVVLLIVTTALAATDALPGSGWWSGEQIQNVGTITGTLSIVAYDSATNDTHTISNEEVSKGASKTFLPWDFPPMPENF